MSKGHCIFQHQLLVNSAVSLAAPCQLICTLSAQLQLANSGVSTGAIRQLSCQLSCNCQISCQLRCDLSRPSAKLNSILPPKLWATFLVATHQSRVHAVTVHCMTRPVQATACLPSLSNNMDIARCVQPSYEECAEMSNKQDASVTSSHLMTKGQLIKYNSTSVNLLCLYSLGTCLACLKQQSLQSMHPCTVRYA